MGTGNLQDIVNSITPTIILIMLEVDTFVIEKWTACCQLLDNVDKKRSPTSMAVDLKAVKCFLEGNA